jgi:hypothetical protein
VTVRELSRGAHRVEIGRDGFATEERRVTITAAQPAHSITVRLAPQRPAPVRPAPAAAARADVPKPGTPATIGRYTAALQVESRPSGAKVFIDGRLVGSTPLVVSEVIAGEHALRLERDGYRQWSSAIRVVAAEQNRVTASLER